MQGRREGGWMDAVDVVLPRLQRFGGGEIGVRGPHRRRESQGCDGALTNSGPLKLDAPPWGFSRAVSEWPVHRLRHNDGSPPRVFNPDTTRQLDISSSCGCQRPLQSLSRSRRYVSWPSPTPTASSDATHRDRTLQDRLETGNRG
jgi:hypothetical protein